MSPREFVLYTLENMKNQSSSSSDENNFAQIYKSFPKEANALLNLITGDVNKDIVCNKLLEGLIEEWIDSAADLFPKSASGLSDAEVSFQERKRQHKGVFVKKWMEQYDSLGLKDSSEMTKIRFGRFGIYLYHVLFMNWSYRAADCERPPIIILDKCLVGKYAKNVVYYVSGWTLQSMSLAKTIAKGNQQLYFDFARDHSLDADTAKQAGLPTSLVERRKRANRYCNQQYYEFISFVESTYLANFNLEMMMAYVDGDLIHEIKMKMIESDVALAKFSSLCNKDESLNTEEMQQIMKYIMERYANMRGTYFVKHLKGNGNSSVEKLVDNQATRTRVMNAAACSKAVHEAKKEGDTNTMPSNDTEEELRQLWKDAAQNVFEKHDKELSKSIDSE